MGRFSSLMGPPGTLERRYAVATGVLALLILGIILLFGHLISQSLSRRYLEDLLISGREEAEQIAGALDPGGQGDDLFEVVERRRELLVRSLAGLPQRKVWESVKVVDREGTVVMTYDLELSQDLPAEVALDPELVGPVGDRDLRETESSYQIAVPLGQVGEVVLSLSKGRLAERVARLRGELLRQTLTVAGLTLVTLVLAFALVWKMIQRNRTLEAQRHAAEEMAALGALAANLAHEIRNPLNSINLNLELLEEDLAGSTRSEAESLTTTRQEVGRLARLVSDFLTYARPSEPRVEEVRIGHLMREVGEFLRAEARRSSVHLRLSPDVPDVVVRGDQAQLRQVLLNLLLNAIQAVGNLEPERQVVELAVEVDARSVALVVRDRGDGVTPDDLEQVRRAFVTRRRGGTGLGLAIADRIATAHGGRIDLTNLEPRGFEARLVLPRAGDDGKMGRSFGVSGWNA